MSDFAREWQKDLFQENVSPQVNTKEKVEVLPATVATFAIVLIALWILKPSVICKTGKPFEEEEFNWVSACFLACFASGAVYLWNLE